MGAKCKVIQVPRDRIGVLFAEIPEMIVKGLIAARNLTIKEVADGLVSGEFELWIIVDSDNKVTAAYMSTLEDEGFDGARSVWLFALSGSDVRDWIDACHASMVNYAYEVGAKSVCLAGRTAWTRVLPKEFHVVGQMEDHYVYARRVA